MELEQWIWRDIEKTLTTASATAATASASAAVLPLRTLSSIRSLVTNHSTSATTRTTVFQTLTAFLSRPLHLRTHLHLLTLISAAATTTTTTATATALLSSSSTSPSLAAAALSVLLSIPDFDFNSVDNTVLISLPFRPSVSVRVWFLNNAAKFNIQANLLVTVMLGFTKDPYPNVRQAALIGLARICRDGVVVEDSDVIELCYFRAVELFRDPQDYVRVAAVRAAGEWGRMLAGSKQEELQRDWFDFVFLQLCSTVRDMNVGVRVETFTALGKFNYVSENILLQSLSKKVEKKKEKQYLAPCSARQCKVLVANAAGAFIHGLEDDFSEVQQAACVTLRMLPVIPGEFAGKAFNIVSYVLNDDSIIVRLEALKTLHRLAVSGCLKLEEVHIEMLLGALVDSCPHIRTQAIHTVGSVKLPSLELSKMTVDSLLECLGMYPKSEADIFRALFSVGQNNENHSVSIIEGLSLEIESWGREKFGGNNHKFAGLTVLAISASLKHEDFRILIPQKIFSFGAAFFGRISHTFTDILDADSLLQYLSHCGNWRSEAQSEAACQAFVGSARKDQLQTHDYGIDAVNLIPSTVKSLWVLVKSGCTSDVLRALRCCKESLRTTTSETNEYTGAVAFALQYIHTVKLISKIWDHFTPSKNHNFSQVGQLDILFTKLDKSLTDLKSRFTGLEKELELYILELVLLSYIMPLSSTFQVNRSVLLKLRTTVTLLQDLSPDKSVVFSEFLNQISDSFSKHDSSSYSDPSTLKKLRDLFTLKSFSLSRRIKEVKAEIVVIGFDSVTPLQFIPGLPVGIPFEVTFYNVVTDHVLWLKLTLTDRITEFVFMDMEDIGDDGDLRDVQKVKFSSTFYRTPRAEAFTLRVSLGMECNSEDLDLVNGHGGPEHALTYISPEIDVYFVHCE